MATPISAPLSPDRARAIDFRFERRRNRNSHLEMVADTGSRGRAFVEGEVSCGRYGRLVVLHSGSGAGERCISARLSGKEVPSGRW